MIYRLKWEQWDEMVMRCTAEGSFIHTTILFRVNFFFFSLFQLLLFLCKPFTLT